MHPITQLAGTLVLAAAISAPRCSAQIPDGHFLTAHIGGHQNLGTGGLFTFHPRNGSWTRIGGLPTDLTGQGSTVPVGANAVAILPDRTVVAGHVSGSNATLSLYHLRLSGGAATVLRRVPLGVGTGGLRAQVAEIEVVGPDRVLIAVSTLARGPIGGQGPLAGHALGFVTPSTGVVTPCPIVPMPAGAANAVAGDGRWAYVAFFDNLKAQTEIWKVDCTQAIPPLRLVTLTNQQVNNLELRPGNRLVAIGAPVMYTIDTSTGAITAQCPFNANALETERVSGMVAGVQGSTTNQDVWWAPPCGTKTVLASPPPGGWGLPAGIAVAHDPIAFAPPSPPNGPDYRFQLDPNPGGLPLAGNTGFSLSVANRGGGVERGAWLLSGGPQVPPLRILGIDLHVSLPLFWASWPIAASPNKPATLRLGIPANPVFAGTSLYVQTVHLNGSALAASEGLRITAQ